MKSGMKMMAVNEMRRRRDSRGRFMEGGQGGQMEMGYGRMEGGQMNQGAYNRMEGGGGRSRMEGGGSARMGGYDRMEGEMRGGMESEMRRGGGRMEAEMRQGGGGRGGNRSEGGNTNRMEEGGASSHYWPGPIPPPYGGEDMRMRGSVQEEMNIRPGRERRENRGMMYPEDRMNDNNVVNISEYQDRRRIGFGANRMHYGDENRKHGGQYMEGGSANQQSEYPMMEQLTEEVATAWVSKLKNTDPENPIGAKWSRETLKPIAIKNGFTTQEKQLEFWVVMNMMYSDYAETAKKNGVSTMDFFADMAKAWMKDKDAVEHKTTAYIMCCTE